MCFGGTAAVVADDEAALALAAASRHHQRQRRSSLASSFRWKFLPGTGKNGDKSKNKNQKPSSPTKKKAYSVFGGASIMTSSSVPSSAPLSSADSTASSLSSSCPSSVSASSSVLRALPSPPRSTPKRQAAAGAAAVVLCLLTVVLCGRVGSTLLTSAALYLLPLRRGHPAARRDVVAEESSVAADYDAVSSASVSDAEEDTTAKRKRQVVRMGSAVLWRNRKIRVLWRKKAHSQINEFHNASIPRVLHPRVGRTTSASASVTLVRARALQ
ncbi:hypothetical protein QOZ80_7BG0603490 [Eleusine coracana subsp. coracana]|nr:hypothetical protein QOZ80_7BG0603490 [Eleusine coracana subsp. coracana]